MVRHRHLASWTIAMVAALLTVSGCGSGSSDSPAAGTAAATAAGTAADRAGGSAVGGWSVGSVPTAADGSVPALARSASASRSSYDAASTGNPALAGQALIKTAAVTLESNDVATVIAKTDELAARTGGDIASEDTSTNTDGVQVQSRIELEVPVGDFDRAVDAIARFGDLVSKSRSSQDVTSRVIDVSSRVTSARDSIAQLRTLFGRATKLGDVIDLERELSDREANLEALQSQQRNLAARTTMSTITVNVGRPSPTSPTHRDQAHGGFLSGLQQGWHSLVAFVAAFSHGVGLVLPLGTLALGAAVVAFVLVRRLTPRRVPHTSE